MPGHVDRADLLEPEVPGRVRVEEGPDETAAGPVHVQRHVEATLALDLQQQVVDSDDVVLVAGERRAEHGRHTDGVLVDVGLHVVGADRVLSRLQRQDPGLDVEVAAELLPHDVHIAAEHQVRARCRRSRGLATLSPVPLEGKPPSMIASDDPWVRAPVVSPGAWNRSASIRMQRCSISAVRGYSAWSMKLRCRFVGDDLLRLRLHPGRHESRQVPGRVTLEGEVLGQPAGARPRRACRSPGTPGSEPPAWRIGCRTVPRRRPSAGQDRTSHCFSTRTSIAWTLEHLAGPTSETATHRRRTRPAATSRQR